MIKSRVTLDYSKVPENRPVKLRALLQVDAENPRGQRRPLNIGVVLDRSGSMQGSKIHNVKEATKLLAGRLGGEDTFSLTIFDHVIETVHSPSRMGNGLATLNNAVDRIEARGSTDLCGGYEEGCEKVLKARGNGALDRVVLFTDGLANVGVTNPVEIASISGRMAEKGIVTSTIGVGADYSEYLLGRMAEAGGGNTYFLQSASEIEEVLEEELGSLLTLVAEGLRVRFESAVDGVRAEQLNAYRVAADRGWVLGDVYGKQTKILVLELEIPSMPLGNRIRCGTFHLSFTLSMDGGTREIKESLPLDLDVVPEKEFAAQTVDAEVTLRAVELKAAAARTNGWELSNRGDFEGAAKALDKCADEVEKIASSDPAIAKHIAALRSEAIRLKDEREAYYTPMMSKSMYTEAYYARRGKYGHLDHMRSRHAGYGPTSFPIQDVGGHLLVELPSGRYLVDTGWPISIGDGSSIQVGPRSFDVKPRVDGADAASISRDIGAQVSGVLGADILGQFDVWIDLVARILAISESCMPLPGIPLKADFRSGVPILPVEIGGVPVRVVLSTGCRISFLKAGLAVRGEPVGRAVETLAGVGDHETEMRKVEFRLGGRSCDIPVGTAPPTLERALSAMGAEGVLGVNFLGSKRMGMSARQGIVTIGSGS